MSGELYVNTWPQPTWKPSGDRTAISRTRGANVTHGRAATYNKGCRCDECRRVATLRRAAARARVAARVENVL